MCPLRYYPMLRQSKEPTYLRFELVRYARTHGIKPAARQFSTTVKTVRKWLRRWRPARSKGWKTRAARLVIHDKASPRGSASRPSGSSGGCHRGAP